MRFHINLFGPPGIEVDGERHALSARKAMALLAYLTMRMNEPVTRGHLSGLLWPDSPEEQARTNLRQALSQLRKLFATAGHDPLEASGDQVVLRPDGIAAPARALLAGELEDAMALAGQPAFLEGFASVAAPFEDWANARAREIDARMVSALTGVAEQAAEMRDHARASAALAEALRRDPLNEALHRKLMRMLAAMGKTDVALAQYETCRKALETQLGVTPESETRQLASQIRAARLAPASADAGRSGVVTVFLTPSGAFDHVAEAASTEEALSAAFNHNRDGKGRAVVLSAAEADSDPQGAARQLLSNTEAGCVASPAIMADTDHGSAFGFAPCAGSEGYEVAQVPRHRLQVGTVTERPEQKLGSDLSLLILPFQDLHSEPGSIPLGLVLAEEITARVSRFGGLTVASPTAAQTCRKLGLDVADLKDSLGVNYLVDGSVLRMGDHLRIAMSITDLNDMSTIHSDRFDGRFDELFAQQSLMVDRIATLVVHKAEIAASERAERALTNSMGAFDWYLRGLYNHRRAGLSLDNAKRASRFFTEAIDIDRDFARSYAWRVCSTSWFDGDYALGDGLRDLSQALAIHEHDPEVQRIAGAIAMMNRDFDKGLHHVQRAVELNPSDAYLTGTSAVYWCWSGQHDKAQEVMDRALALDPFLPVWAVEDQGVLLYSRGDYAGAVDSLKRLSFPTPRALSFMAAAQVAQDDIEGARDSVAQIYRLDPDYSFPQLEMVTLYKDLSQTDGLRKRLEMAGLS
ncbi:BTAD domain-containing putative transcriptional regulator [Primorskyibacter aestuariivivens]|uniref:BTAD domain-containing putative transcriptional regulator n=1 Tax=Primorskyibacter aestuariivivens TaxID=1888912 RepID=UPI0023005490|nr:BTAD domain-containing putative transcriptional regulator [Primorskyibacter aestuariivivens]MDA7429027.1 BTAD domain-containing putative transcriptional regulator [Primorskyibacter aestuariivivens]